MTWLVTGGAGYVGGHVVRRLIETGRDVVVLDDLSGGDARRVPPGVPLVRECVTSTEAVTSVLSRHRVTGVMHLAGVKAPAESVRRPLRYYRTNVDGTLALLEAMAATRVRMLVFSSSAAVYGNVAGDQVSETAPTNPANPYGETKLVGERLIAAAAGVSGLRHVSLRYFNVAGAAEPWMCEREGTNLVPQVLGAVAAGRPARVFGCDYATPDGSCVRDFVHVVDVADAHVAMAERLEHGGCDGTVYNVGRGHGYSVLEVLGVVRAVLGRDFPVSLADRRDGDPPRVVADVDRIARDLGWRARFDLTDMVRSEWLARVPVQHTGR